MSVHLLLPALRVSSQIEARRNVRRLSSAIITTAADAAQRLLEDFSGTTVTRRQVLDANQLQKLSLSLGRKHIHPAGQDVSVDPPSAGTPVPPGYHLVYFTPGGVESELGRDGTDKTFNAPSPFTRRMWAGGQMRWNAHAPLRVGEEVEERTVLLSATPKTSRSAGEMVLVEVQKEFWGPKGLAVVDKRSWVFRPEVTATPHDDSAGEKKRKQAASFLDVHGASTIKDESTQEAEFPVRQLRWSPVGLFRFSALTFNGHKIHYNEGWTAEVEGHPGLVVHGPLNLISILDYWRDVHGQGTQQPSQITYRAMAPIYAGESYSIETAGVQDGQDGRAFEILAMKRGATCMKSEVLASASS
ncbi:Mesaconyl-c4 hydratase [Pleurostoma richardsiae]|uniref:Mesaconyl-c4 hydratase n=1 Tax=Pleurostoma richardsiae TaxID=41990 RepID=A0AA38RPQ6_9PEZI|nr:Mesaconyl-c4 hydratase [Pleurostoma richardsiae]